MHRVQIAHVYAERDKQAQHLWWPLLGYFALSTFILIFLQLSYSYYCSVSYEEIRFLEKYPCSTAVLKHCIPVTLAAP